jgi:hypothetical protein
MFLVQLVYYLNLRGLANIKLGLKWVPATNAQAYLRFGLNHQSEKFYVQGPDSKKT